MDKDLHNKDVDTAIRKGVLSVVKSKDPSAKVYLFGSRARLDYSENSDWDFFVATTKDDPRKFEDELIDSVYGLMLEYDELIQIIAYPKVNWEEGMSPSPIYDNIREEGLEL